MSSIRRCWILGLGMLCLHGISGWALTQEVYVWQRQFSPAVQQAMTTIREDVAGFAILAAEVRWEKDQPQTFRSRLDYKMLVASGRPIGLVLRIGPYAKRFAADDHAAKYLCGMVVSLLNEARSAGLKPAELQIDFDCASSKLAGYRLWVEAIRNCAGETETVFTALPDWLHRDVFKELAHAADGYVLQVHSLEKPTGPNELFQLCNPERSWNWIQRASEIGVPFRVALPTYGYRLAFDTAGKFLMLAAEGSPQKWPAGAQIRVVRSDASSMAVLVTRLMESEISNCTGIIWFRLPVAGDELNWDIATLKVVLQGKQPAAQLVLQIVWSSAGLAEVLLINNGERDETLPQAITLRWNDESDFKAGDGLGGYSLSAPVGKAGMIELKGSPGSPELSVQRIAPGRSRKIGWIRFNHETSITSQITESF